MALAGLALSAGLPAMGTAGRKSFAELHYEQGRRSYASGDYAEAEAVFKSISSQSIPARRAWLGLLFERQGYAALELALKGARLSNEERLLLARSQANQSKWADALLSLENLETRDARVARLRAEALEATGDTRAGAAWAQAMLSLTRTPELALIHFKAARFLSSIGKPEDAEAAYRRAERLDQAYSFVHRPLSDIYRSLSRPAEARQRLEKAVSVDPKDEEARASLSAMLSQNKNLEAENLAMARRREKEHEALKNRVVESLPARAGEPLLRIGLLTQSPSFKFKAGGPMKVGLEGISLPAGAIVDVSLRGAQWRLLRKDGGREEIVARFSEPLRLEPEDASSTLALFDVAFGSGYYFAAKEDRFYRGAFVLKPEGLKGVTLINEIPLDSYLLGVVPAEVQAYWPHQVLRAQAIAARGDTLSKIGRHGKEGFDLCPEVHCEMYRGAGLEDRRSSKAVMETRGEVLRQGKGGKLLPAIYMGACGGHTMEAWEAWSGEPKLHSHAVFDGPPKSAFAGRFPLDPAHLLDYLEDPHDAVQAWCGRASSEPYSHYRWIMRYSPGELSGFANRRYPVGKVKAVEVLERSASGHVRRMRIIGDKQSSISSSDYIRSSLKGLRSNLFYVETRRDALGEPVEFLFHGGGWGHGVGLCQDGAMAQAEAGRKAEEILLHYYKGGIIEVKY